MSTKPVVGITSRKIHFFHKDRPFPRFGVAIDYCAAVEAAGGTPLVLPLTQDVDVLEGMFGVLDGLLLPGGLDVDPVHYGEEPSRHLDGVDPLRDLTELHLAKRALADDLPTFGICRGAQLLNVAAGGSLHQDVHEGSSGPTLKHFQDYSEEWPSHSVDVEQGTILSEIVGARSVRVNSYHHQAVKAVAPGFRVSARAKDGVVEGVESTVHRYVVGVQWHPELQHARGDFNLALFRRHVLEAAANRDRRRAAPSRR
jgi:gamma-glutamyl-gamma-aminobutyrate hydrolase PuuD